jgi:hypothetical protein
VQELLSLIETHSPIAFAAKFFYVTASTTAHIEYAFTD